jgi:hypothetical protein
MNNHDSHQRRSLSTEQDRRRIANKYLHTGNQYSIEKMTLKRRIGGTLDPTFFGGRSPFLRDYAVPTRSQADLKKSSSSRKQKEQQQDEAG